MSEDRTRKLMESVAKNPNGAVHINQLKTEGEEDIYRIAKMMGTTFADCVDALRQYAPHPHTRELAMHIWDVVRYGAVKTAVTTEVETISFAAINMNDSICAIILIPTRWLIFCAHDLRAQMGGILLSGSNAVDWFHGRIMIDGPEKVKKRARAYEAEYVQSLGNVVVDDPYYKELLVEFPDGFPEELEYMRLPPGALIVVI